VSWVVWFTGRPAAGKTTLARALKELAADRGVALVHLESDSLRRILTPQPTYAAEERDRFYEMVAALAALLAGQGIPVIVDATSPRRAHRGSARRRIPVFLEVFVDTPPDVCERRDPKGLYRKARAGEIKNFTGISSPYEPPLQPDIRLDAASADPETLADQVLAFLRRGGYLRG
jgi:adenylylsulfate kinase